MKELPNWVYDLVSAVEQYEENHPSFLFVKNQPLSQTGSSLLGISNLPYSVDFAGWNWCIQHMLKLIPVDVRNAAETIRCYKMEAEISPQND